MNYKNNSLGRMMVGMGKAGMRTGGRMSGNVKTPKVKGTMMQKMGRAGMRTGGRMTGKL